MKLTIETECPNCNMTATSVINFLGKDMEAKLQLEEIAMLSLYCPNCEHYIVVNEIETYIEED